MLSKGSRCVGSGGGVGTQSIIHDPSQSNRFRNSWHFISIATRHINLLRRPWKCGWCPNGMQICTRSTIWEKMHIFLDFYTNLICWLFFGCRHQQQGQTQKNTDGGLFYIFWRWYGLGWSHNCTFRNQHFVYVWRCRIVNSDISSCNAVFDERACSFSRIWVFLSKSAKSKNIDVAPTCGCQNSKNI